MIQLTPVGFFVRHPLWGGYQGPYPTEAAARAALSNATARTEKPPKCARPPREPAPPAELRMVKPSEGESRKTRRGRAADKRRLKRRLIKLVKKEAASQASPSSASETMTPAGVDAADIAAGHVTEHRR